MGFCKPKRPTAVHVTLSLDLLSADSWCPVSLAGFGVLL